MTVFVLVCRECGNGDLVMPFSSAAERGRWAAEHTRGTGHDRWFVKDVPARSTTEGWQP
jgi:hypothetical protein